MAQDPERGQHDIYDKLEHELSLSHLINPESLSNLVKEFGQFHRVRFVATDMNGALIGSGEGLAHLCALRPEQDPSQCPACAGELPRFTDTGKKFARVACLSQAEFLRVRIDNQFEPIGYLIMGPYAAKPADNINGDAECCAILASDRAEEIGRLMCTVLEEVVFANFQSYLFSKMHLQLSKDNLGDVTGESNSDPTYEETMLDSGEFRSLF